MITRIELDGFKTFSNFSLDLAPLSVIVGANGVGKTNLFAAILLLSRLAETDIYTAFQDLQSEYGELFTILPDGSTVDQMRLAVEVLLDRRVRDDWGSEVELSFTRLRYELNIKRSRNRDGVNRLFITKENLFQIKNYSDRWSNKNRNNTQAHFKKTRRIIPFISTKHKESEVITNLHRDGIGVGRQFKTYQIERSVLNSVNQTDFPHTFALRNEMRSWKLLRMDINALRQSSPPVGNSYLTSSGGNLPAALARINAEDPFFMSDISLNLSGIIPGISKITVALDESSNRLVVSATSSDGRVLSSQLMSDGTMRMLALVTFKYDPDHHGVLCLEEPENGIHPLMLRHMAKLLSNLSTDFGDSSSVEWPLQQLIVNTHSPILISQPEFRNNLFYASMPTLISNGKPSMRVTRIKPIETTIQKENIKKDNAYTLDQVIKYLSTVDEAIEVRDQIEGKSDKSAA
ncbi:MAG: AAA family ATPase [Roseiflexaceae bacterium]